MCGFTIAKTEKCRKLVLLISIDNGADLERKLKQSKLVVMPLRDFPSDLPILIDNDQGRTLSTSLSSTSSSLSTSTSPLSTSTSSLYTSPNIMYNRSRLQEAITDLESDEEDEVHETVTGNNLSSYLISMFK